MIVEPAVHERTAGEDGLEAVVASKSGHDAVQQGGVGSRNWRGHEALAGAATHADSTVDKKETSARWRRTTVAIGARSERGLKASHPDSHSGRR